MRALNLGCGTSSEPSTDQTEWVNLDRTELPGVDVVHDLEDPLPFPDDHFDHIHGSHILEHLTDLLPVVEELWRVTKAGGTAEFRVPYGGSDEAWCDPTHRRAFFQGSWTYFAAPTFWMADYGYRGDWALERVHLRIPVSRVTGLGSPEIFDRVLHGRNIVTEMVALLRCVKPARVVGGQPLFETNIVLDLIDAEPNAVRY